MIFQGLKKAGSNCLFTGECICYCKEFSINNFRAKTTHMTPPVVWKAKLSHQFGTLASIFQRVSKKSTPLWILSFHTAPVNSAIAWANEALSKRTPHTLGAGGKWREFQAAHVPSWHDMTWHEIWKRGNYPRNKNTFRSNAETRQGSGWSAHQYLSALPSKLRRGQRSEPPKRAIAS